MLWLWVQLGALSGQCGQACRGLWSWGQLSTQMSMLEEHVSLVFCRELGRDRELPLKPTPAVQGDHTGISLLCFSQAPITRHQELMAFLLSPCAQ